MQKLTTKLLGTILTAALLLPAVSQAHGPSRQKVEESVIINAPPEKVWEVIGDFSAMDKWHPAVVSMEMKDEKHRILTIGEKGGPTITEELKKLDDENMMYKYKIVDMSTVKSVEFKGNNYDVPTVPVNNYLSTVKLEPADGGSKVTWTGKFYRIYQLNYEKTEPRYPEGLGDKEAVEAVTSIYKSGLENLKKMIEGS